jgi:hypothetical protein
MVKNKKTIKRQKHRQNQKGKGICGSKQSSKNNSIEMNNVSKTENGNILYANITNTLILSNKILENIEKSKNPQDELTKVKNLLGLIMKLKEIDVIKNDTDRYKFIIIKLVSINKKIKSLHESNA